MKLSTAHKQMVEDGCPRFLLRTGGMGACEETFARLRIQAAREPTMRRISHPKDIPQVAPAAAPDVPMAPKKPSKRELVTQMLIRKEGCTRDEAAEATGYAKIHVPTWAKAAGIKVTIKVENGVTMYFGSK